MSRFEKFLMNHAFVAVVLALVVAGHVFGIEGAKNMAAFVVLAVLVPLHTLVLSADNIKQQAKAAGEKIPTPVLKRCLGAAVIGLAAWYGAFFTAAGMLLCVVLGMCYTQMHNAEVEKNKLVEELRGYAKAAA